MTRDQIKAIALAHGFTERQQADGSMDLNGYVYAFAEAIYAEGQRAMRERAAEMIENTPSYSSSPKAVFFLTKEARQEQAVSIRALEVKPS